MGKASAHESDFARSHAPAWERRRAAPAARILWRWGVGIGSHAGAWRLERTLPRWCGPQVLAVPATGRPWHLGSGTPCRN